MPSTYDDIFDRETVFVKGFTEEFTYFRDKIQSIKNATNPDTAVATVQDSLTVYISNGNDANTDVVHIGLLIDSSGIVSHIVQNSSASEIGIKIGDTLTSINGADTLNY